MGGQLYYQLFLPPGCQPRLPQGSVFKVEPMPPSFDPHANWVIGAGPVPRPAVSDSLRAELDRDYPERHLLWASGEPQEIFPQLAAALGSAIADRGSAWVNDLLSGLLIRDPDPQVLSHDPKDMLSHIGLPLLTGEWALSRGLLKYGLPELALHGQGAGRYPTKCTLWELLQELMQGDGARASDRIPVEEYWVRSVSLAEAAQDTQKLLRAQREHLDAIKTRIGERPFHNPGIQVLLVEDDHARDATHAFITRPRPAPPDDPFNLAEDEDAWWQRTWNEREELLESYYGPSTPLGSQPGTVLALDESLRMAFPGACVYVFPAAKERQLPDWLYVTHGPSQPLTPRELQDGGKGSSGTGWEFGLLTPENAAWAPPALRDLLAYSICAEPRLDMGHRVPFTLVRRPDSQDLLPRLDRPTELTAGEVPVGPFSALLLWPTLDPWPYFRTSTGTFDILIGTGITLAEWELAQQTSSPHLLLLLHKAGIGQRTDPTRSCVTQPGSWPQGFDWEKDWGEIRALSRDDALDSLCRQYGRERVRRSVGQA